MADKSANTKDNEKANLKEETGSLKFGPLPKFSTQHRWSRSAVILGVVVYIWYNSKSGKDTILAKQGELHVRRGQSLNCNQEYLKEVKQFSGCAPLKCGRYVSDNLITLDEVEVLLNVAKKAFSFGESSGGASILDLHSGALSHKENFINVYSLLGIDKIITHADLTTYRMAKDKIQHAIAENFGINKESIFLTHPTFFSKLTDREPTTPHDEYWHIHVDRETYESFHYTSLLYLTNFNIDFKGGRIMFVDNIHKPSSNVTVEPRAGRVLMFTSGQENPHFVERVTDGTRYAITVSFTCDKSKSISDPVIKL